VANMNHYQCTFCSYTYKPERGDKINEIPPGTAFEDLPDGWKCPTCRHPKMDFVEVKK